MAVFERTGGYPPMLAPLGRLLAREKDVDRLSLLVGDAVDEPRASTDLRLVGARLRLLQGNPEGAKKLADEAVAREPNNWEAHMLLAEAYRATGDHELALQAIQQSAPSTPQAELHFVKGRILEFNGKFEEAQPEYGKAVELDPDMQEARLLYGRSLAYQGSAQLAIENLDSAIAAYEAMKERAPGLDLLLGDAYAARGVARRELGNLKEAETDLARGVELNPNNGEAWLKLGLTRFTSTKYGPATEALQKAAEVIGKSEDGSTRHLDALFSLAQAAEKSKKTNVAKEAIGKYLGYPNAEKHKRYAEAERLAKSLR
jgi:tetratricopeptide (TPR) repeat protein